MWRYFGISFAILDRFVCHTLIVWYFMGDKHSFSMYYVIVVLSRYFFCKLGKHWPDEVPRNDTKMKGGFSM